MVALEELGALTACEAQVVSWMRKLSQTSPEWKLTLTKHSRQQGSYLQVEPTPYLKVTMQRDQFLAVE